jgi:hypothetical protein
MHRANCVHVDDASYGPHFKSAPAQRDPARWDPPPRKRSTSLAISVWRKAGFFTSQCFHQGLSKAMIKKGDIITIKPQWQDAGHASFTWVARDDEENGRVGGTEQHPQRDLPVPCRLLARL